MTYLKHNICTKHQQLGIIISVHHLHFFLHHSRSPSRKIRMLQIGSIFGVVLALEIANGSSNISMLLLFCFEHTCNRFFTFGRPLRVLPLSSIPLHHQYHFSSSFPLPSNNPTTVHQLNYQYSPMNDTYQIMKWHLYLRIFLI